ncbi:hypothetical protein SISSUDRAFT_97293 [Sistotremastrum suecicum HHB10207 ss-3]|uniref:Uncharacterized protein n=1 Tax=Sistotremastrum suecicum HHB10207 ss-3 TaxID=1314776 RepID=A0A166B7K4_9AGAM|nr:hypothetical protein SISSUDRAFT_97293 [Sistotremastrum suecicum HHB10207 ss-3]
MRFLSFLHLPGSLMPPSTFLVDEGVGERCSWCNLCRSLNCVPCGAIAHNKASQCRGPSSKIQCRRVSSVFVSCHTLRLDVLHTRTVRKTGRNECTDITKKQSNRTSSSLRPPPRTVVGEVTGASRISGSVPCTISRTTPTPLPFCPAWSPFPF